MHDIQETLDELAAHHRRDVRSLAIGIMFVGIAKVLMLLVDLYPEYIRQSIQNWQMLKEILVVQVIVIAPAIVFGARYFLITTSPMPQEKPESVEYRIQRKGNFYKTMLWLMVIGLFIHNVQF
ncbi:MAG: hypothetical protein AAF902_21270 [Chloroflexota bacterium]